MTNIFCKHLDVDLSIDLSVIDQFNISSVATAFKINAVDASLESFLKPLNIFAKTPVCFYTPPYADRGFHHVDSMSIDNTVKLNFIINGQNTVMQWFKFNGSEESILLHKNVTGGGYLKFNPTMCELLWEEELKSPSLVNAGIPHNVKSRSNIGRWSISYPLYTADGENLQWHQAIDIFKNIT